MQLDEVRVRSVLRRRVALVEAVHEAQFAHADRPRAAVQHDVEPDRLVRIVSGGDDETVRLHRAIHGGDVAANELPSLRRQRRLSASQRIEPLGAVRRAPS